MNTNKIFGAIALSLISIGCSNKEKNAKPLEALKSHIETNSTTMSNSNVVDDSISSYEIQIHTLLESKTSKQDEIKMLSKQRDALKSALEEIKKSQQQLAENKIDKNINSVSAKLDALKEQREQIVEQKILKSKEVALAEKKIVLWQEEKEVYDAQRKSLHARGAAPDEFKILDSLLSGINGKIRSQSKAVAMLKRSIDDMEEQRNDIDVQQAYLSDKIRDNYSSKQIIDDFVTEEKQRLNQKLVAVETTLNDLLDEVKYTDEHLAMNASKKNAFENERALSEEKAKAEGALVADRDSLSTQKQAATQKKAKRRIAFIGVGVLAIALLLLYAIGRKLNNKH